MNAVIGSPHESKCGDYHIGKRIATISGAYLHHAHLANGESVVLKQLRFSPLIPVQLSRFSREFELLHSLDIKGIVKARALIGEQTQAAIVLDYFDGESLESHLDRLCPDVGTCLRWGAELARTLASLHAAGIIHRDMRPANLFLTQEAQHILIVDLSLAGDMQGVSPRADAPGDWAYVSPEHTGRMNHPVDYRTDMYSLGVTLYRMLTGRLPFAAEDALEWAHCHVARSPTAPCDLVPAIPRVVSDLVMRLLAKLPEDRYQSMRGVQFDLERCSAQWRSESSVLPFALQSQDFSAEFYVPRKLYGRQQEVAQLHKAFSQMAESGQPMLVTIGGYAGIGKSALVNDLQLPIARERGYLISGKFDQIFRDTPYAILRQAFQDLIRQLLSESEASIVAWREDIQAAVGAHGQLIVDILPQVELLIGKQPLVQELSPAEAQHRFLRVFRRFVAVFARPSHPLVLFLDDLQWIDAGSLQLIESLLVHADTRSLLLIGAYRDNEVNAAHPLISGIAAIRRAGVPVQEIVLAPLSLDILNRLVADTVHATATLCESLTQLIFEKTGGNSLFFIQFLIGLYKEGLLHYDAEAQAWRWELGQIRGRNFADNVVDLMLDKLRRLPATTQESLQFAACLGNKFFLDHLAVVNEKDVSEVAQHLSLAYAEGLVMVADGSGRFLHDRIQQAAYSLIPERQRGAIHLSIGRLLLRHLSAQDMAEHLFDVANQFNRGVALLIDPQEKEQVADLNLRAGRKAKASAAHASACVYLAAGMAQLGEADWEKNYRLTFDLWFERAHCEFLSGHLEEATELVDVLLQRRLPKIDQASVYHLKAWLYVFKSENPQAIDMALAYLRLFGMELPAHPTWEEVEAEYALLDKNMEGRSIESLIDLPLIADPDVEAIVRMLSALLTPAAVGHCADTKLVQLSSCRLIRLTLQYGVSSEAVACYAHFMVHLACAPFHRWHDAYRFGQLACALVEKHGFVEKKAMVYYCAALMVYTTRSLSEALECMQKSLRAAIETDDIFMACIIQMIRLELVFRAGDPLNELWRESEKSLAFTRQVRLRDIEDTIIVYQRFFATMQGRAKSEMPPFGDATFDEEVFERQLTSGRMSVLSDCYWVLKVETGFFSGDYATALAAAEKLIPVPGYFWFSGYHYYSALAMTAVYDAASSSEQRAWRDRLAERQTHLRKLADINPLTFGDRHALISAEISRIEGRDLDAMLQYQQAITLAHDNGYAQNEGIAYECASRFYRKRGFVDFADTYIRAARECFARWGASAKVAQLEASYSVLRTDQEAGSTRVSGDGVVQLDMLSVTKASQAISRCIVLHELIDTLMRIVLENAGAQQGSLLLVRNNEWMQVADVLVDQQTVRVQRHFEPNAASLLPLPTSILNYVRRSRENVLIADASQSHVFSSDEYFIKHHKKSVLCLPILRQDALIGMLYLENSLITNAFTPERLAVLDLLAAQAAISLENALLYTDLEQENGERKRAQAALRKAHDELEMRVRDRTAALNKSNHQLQGEILERRQAEADLARSNAELEQLAYVASHDLQEPLRMVASYLQLLEQRYRNSLDADAHEFIGFAVNGAKRMQSLIDDLLTYSRIGTRAMPLQPVDCAAVVATVQHSLRMAIADGDAQVSFSSLPVVMADVTQLTQLFQNLLANAIKFRSEKRVRIHVGAEMDGDYWRFAVQDNGIGIAPEYFGRIFEMFQRLHSQRLYAGTGMGLAICKKIVERHGGRIWVVSIPGQGATFYFTLPAFRDNAQ